MIAKIELINYRTHAHTVISPGELVAIIGSNDVGKSNIYRALEILLFNRDFPLNNIKQGESSSTIAVELTTENKDGSVNWDVRKRIERTRDQKASWTTLIYPDGKREELKGNKNLDEIITEFTGFGEVVLDKQGSSENVQMIPSGMQNYTPMYSPEGILRRLVNLMAGANVANAKVNLEKEYKALNTEVKIKEELVAYQDNVLSKLNSPIWVNIEEEYNKLLDRQRSIDNETIYKKDLTVMYDNIATNSPKVICSEDRLKEIDNALLKIERDLDNLKYLSDKYETMLSIYKNIEELEVSNRDYYTDLDTCIAQIAGYEADLIMVKDEVCPTCGRTY